MVTLPNFTDLATGAISNNKKIMQCKSQGPTKVVKISPGLQQLLQNIDITES